MEFDEICQSFFRVDDTMIFSFYDHEFYQDSENNLCYGKLLLIDFKNFIKKKEPEENAAIGNKKHASKYLASSLGYAIHEIFVTKIMNE